MAENLVDVDVVEEATNFLVWSILICWLATDVGCMAIWPLTAPNRSSHKGVAMQCPLVGISPNLGKKAHVVVVDQFGFNGMNVLYDEAGNEYPIDDAGQLYVPLGFEQTVVEEETEVENIKEPKN